jgi:hypothetical protein
MHENSLKKEPKSFGNKRNRITETQRQWIHDKFELWKRRWVLQSIWYNRFFFPQSWSCFQVEDEMNLWITEALMCTKTMECKTIRTFMMTWLLYNY